MAADDSKPACRAACRAAPEHSKFEYAWRMNAEPVTPQGFLPDFCRTPAVLSLLLISQIVACLLVLASPAHDLILGPRLIVVSLYLHWISLLSAAALCWLRRYLDRMSVTTLAGVAFIVLVGITLLVSEMAYHVGRFMGWESFLLPNAHLLFLARNALICSIVAAAVLRYFYVIHAWRRQVQASAEARFAALQARIRPHFFFNSLNSVAALIPTRPDDAESLIEDLSDLFRAILKNRQPFNRLADEIELGKTYLRVEQIRLGERLTQHWQVDDGLDDLQLPLLSLQPLLENAIYHGIECIPGGGTLSVEIRRDKDELLIVVSNPMSAREDDHGGSGIAQDNIRQRLRLLYDDRGCLETRQTQEGYRAELRVPV